MGRKSKVIYERKLKTVLDCLGGKTNPWHVAPSLGITPEHGYWKVT